MAVFFFKEPGMKPFRRLVPSEEAGVLGLFMIGDTTQYLTGYHPGCQTGPSEKPAETQHGGLCRVKWMTCSSSATMVPFISFGTSGTSLGI